MEFPSGYPYKAPRVKFITSCFHPNVDDQGFICLDILKDKWSALYDVRSILLSIQSLLGGKALPTEINKWHSVHQVDWNSPNHLGLTVLCDQMTVQVVTCFYYIFIVWRVSEHCPIC